MANKLFTAKELQNIEQSVKEAEAISGGEIIPVFARHSSFYEMALWRSGFILAGFCGLMLSVIYLFTDWLLFLPPYIWLLIMLTAGLAGAIMALMLPSLKRSLIGKKILQARVLEQAKNMFYDHNVGGTEQRTGILIFISFFEKQAVILADIGIAELVSEGQWEAIMQSLTRSIKKKKKAAGICQAIQACGHLLAGSGVQKAASDDDDNELPDSVRFSK